jgi:hypothetical protein
VLFGQSRQGITHNSQQKKIVKTCGPVSFPKFQTLEKCFTSGKTGSNALASLFCIIGALLLSRPGICSEVSPLKSLQWIPITKELLSCSGSRTYYDGVIVLLYFCSNSIVCDFPLQSL